MLHYAPQACIDLNDVLDFLDFDMFKHVNDFLRFLGVPNLRCFWASGLSRCSVISFFVRCFVLFSFVVFGAFKVSEVLGNLGISLYAQPNGTRPKKSTNIRSHNTMQTCSMCKLVILNNKCCKPTYATLQYVFQIPK